MATTALHGDVANKLGRFVRYVRSLTQSPRMGQSTPHSTGIDWALPDARVGCDSKACDMKLLLTVERPLGAAWTARTTRTATVAHDEYAHTIGAANQE